MQSQLTDTNALNITSSVWAIGHADKHKVIAILQTMVNLAQEPSEIIVICPDEYLAEIYDTYDSVSVIPIAHDLQQIAKIFNQLVDELHDRQRKLKCYRETSHPIVVAIELDILENAFKQRASELNHEYDSRELKGAIEMLCDSGVEVGIYVIVSTQDTRGGQKYARLYSGTEALKYVFQNSETESLIHQQTIAQKNPCCLSVDGEIYSIDCESDASKNIRMIRESERAIELTIPTPERKGGIFHKIRNLAKGRNQ